MENSDLTIKESLAQFCSECGNKLAISMKFCGGCGAQLASATPTAASAAPLQAASSIEEQSPAQAGEPSLSLLHAWGLYGASYIGLATLMWLKSPVIGILGYLAIGVFMSRFVMRRLVEWHPHYNTLHNVVSAKFWMVLLWPLRMLVLLIQLSANHVL